MPTIIDSFIVELGLDPKQFNQQQKQVVQQLNSLTQQAQQASANFNQNLGVALAKLVSGARQQAQQATSTAQTQTRTLGNLFGLLNRQHAQAQQSMAAAASGARRSGQQISQAGQQGAYGLNSMVNAGLAAYAAMKSLNGMLQSTRETAERTSQSMRNSMAAGMGVSGITRFSAVALAAQATTAADPGAVEQELVELRQAQNLFRTQGVWNERFTAMLRTLPAGDAARLSDRDITPEVFISRLAESLQKMPYDERITWARSQGFGALAPFLALPTARRERATEVAARRAPTPDEALNLDKLRENLTTTEQLVNSLWRAIVNRLSEAGLNDAIEGLNSLLQYLRDNKSAVDALAVAVIAFAAAMTAVSVRTIFRGLGMLTGVGAGGAAAAGGGAVAGATAAKRGVLTRLLGAVGLIDLFGSHGVNQFIPGEIDPKLRDAPGPKPGSFGSRFQRWWRGTAAEEPIPAEQRGGGQVPRGTGFNYGQLKQLALDAGFRGQDASTMAAIAMAESSGNPYARNVTARERSFGLTQINAMAHPGGERAEGDPTYAMNKAFEIYRARQARGGTGFEDWGAYTDQNYRKHLEAANAATPAAYPKGAGNAGYPFRTQGPTSAFPALPEPKGYQPTSGPGYPFTVVRPDASKIPAPRTGSGSEWPFKGLPVTMDAAGPQASLVPGGALAAVHAMRNSRWEARPGDVSNTSYQTDTRIGSVTINTRASDADGIARDMATALKRNMVAEDANMGLDYG